MDSILSNFSKVLILVIKIYQHFISVLTCANCRFYPSCSQYAIEALREFSLIKSLWLIFKRLFKCHPLHQGGEDSIPTKIKSKREH